MKEKTHYTKGQAAVIVVLVMLALIAVLALVLDGGSAYVARRTAQNAADAGALAGANAYCSGVEDPLDVAETYAYKNDATEAEAVLVGDMITVTATVTHNTFFASFVGYDTLDASAVAAASCEPVCPAGVLPVAFSCRPPIGGGETDPRCWLDEPDVPGNPTPQELYIIMDSSDLEKDLVFCLEPGATPPPGCGSPPLTPCPIDCDLDNDGYNDLLSGGDRSWLDLTGGGGGAADLKTWIRGGFPGVVYLDTWYESEPGRATAIFDAVEDIVGTNVYVPVYDQYCKGDPRDPANLYPDNLCHYEDGEDVVVGGGTFKVYYRVIAFAEFHISCVHSVPSDYCDGQNWILNKINDNKIFSNNIGTIEGYFLPPHTIAGSVCEGDAKKANLTTIVLRR